MRFSLALSGSIVLWLLGLGWAVAGDPSLWGPTTAYTWTVPGSYLPNAVPVSLSADGAYTTGCVATPWARAFDTYAQTAAAATLQVQLYADVKCTYPVGAAVPTSAQALSSGGGCPGGSYCGDVGQNNGMPFVGLIVTLTDTSDATNAIGAFVLNLGAE